MRGQHPLAGVHAVSITEDGVRVFPRWPTPRRRVDCGNRERLQIGVDRVDRALAGGVLAGGSVLVEGASGAGKTVLASQFIAECGYQELPGLVVLFEERPDRFIARADTLDLQLDHLIQRGLLDVLSFRGRDVAPDELLYLLDRAVQDIGARAIVLDSSTGLQLMLGDALRDWLWRALDLLCGAGVSVWLNQVPAGGPPLGALFDEVMRIERVEQEARVVRRVDVIKAAGASADDDLVVYDIRARLQPVASRVLHYRAEAHERGSAEHAVSG
jgi:circadian clock protein KaiC